MEASQFPDMQAEAEGPETHSPHSSSVSLQAQEPREMIM